MGAEEIGHLGLIPDPQCMPLGRVQECEPSEIEKPRPTLSVTPDDVCDGQGLVGIGSVIVLEDLKRVRGFNVDRLAQR